MLYGWCIHGALCLEVMIHIIKALLDAFTQHPEHAVNDYMPEIDYEMLPR